MQCCHLLYLIFFFRTRNVIRYASAILISPHYHWLNSTWRSQVEKPICLIVSLMTCRDLTIQYSQHLIVHSTCTSKSIVWQLLNFKVILVITVYLLTWECVLSVWLHVYRCQWTLTNIVHVPPGRCTGHQVTIEIWNNQSQPTLQKNISNLSVWPNVIGYSASYALGST